MEILFEPVWNWLLTILVSIGLLAFVLLTYPRRVAHLKNPWKNLLIVLRVSTALVLIFALFRPALKYTDKDDESAVVAILTDDSRSTTTKDAPGGISRREQMVNLIDDASPLISKLKELVDFRQYNFSGDLKPAVKFEATADGSQTAMGTALKQLAEETRGKKVAAIFLMSDGAERVLKASTITPESSARTAALTGTALYPIPFGATASTGNIVDLALEDLLVDQTVFERKTVPISLKLRAEGAEGQKLEVSLFIENRIGKDVGETGELIPVPLNESNRSKVIVTTDQSSDVIPIELTYTPKQAGEYLLAVEVKTIDGEVLLRNNKLQTLLTVRKGGLKVAYFDVLRSELKFLRRMNQSEKIQVDFKLILNGEFEGRTEIPEKWFEPGEYDVFIIGDVPAKSFGPEIMRQLAARVRDGAGLLMLGGYHTYSPGGYANTPLGNLLPIELNPADEVPSTQIDLNSQKIGEWNIQPTNAGLSHYVMLLASPEKNLELWKSLPTMTSVNRLKPISDFVQVLATTQDDAPVLISSETGRARIVTSAMSETFLWAASGKNQIHQRFWRQMILWLAHKEFDSDQPVWVRVQPHNFPPEGLVPIEMGAQNDKGKPILDAKFDIEVTNPEGQKIPLAANLNGKSSFAEFRKTAKAGTYWVKVDGFKDDQQISLPAYARFIIDDRDIELDNPAADVARLEELARLASETTDSQVIYPENFSSFLREFIEKKSWQTDLEKSKRISLWDDWPLMLIFITLLTSEWTIRKLRNLV